MSVIPVYKQAIQVYVHQIPGTFKTTVCLQFETRWDAEKLGVSSDAVCKESDRDVLINIEGIFFAKNLADESFSDEDFSAC